MFVVDVGSDSSLNKCYEDVGSEFEGIDVPYKRVRKWLEDERLMLPDALQHV